MTAARNINDDDNVLPFDKPTSSFVSITPEMAERWLGRNFANRNILRRRVEGYARDMAAGKWKLTGESIKFDRNGNLIDGQHRLHAILQSGLTVLMVVIRGLDSDAQAVMDSGAKRQLGQDLQMSGLKYANLIASTARLILRYKHGGPSWNFEPTKSDLYAEIEASPEIMLCAELSSRVNHGVDVMPSMIGFTSWLITQTAGFNAANEFWTSTASMVGLSQGDARIAMAKAFSEARRVRKSYGPQFQASAIIRCFNAWAQGRPVKQVKFIAPGGTAIDIPPVVIPAGGAS